MGIHQNLTGAQRTARYRAAKRAQGLRLRQFWVPDLSDPKVQEQIRREVEEINRRDRESGIMDYLESIRAEVWANEPDYDWGPDGPPDDPVRKE